MAHFEAKKREHGGVTSTQCLISTGAGAFDKLGQGSSGRNEHVGSQNVSDEAFVVHGPIESPRDAELALFVGKKALLSAYKALADQYLSDNGEGDVDCDYNTYFRRTYFRRCFICYNLTRLYSEYTGLRASFENVQTDKDLLSAEIEKLIPRLGCGLITLWRECARLAPLMGYEFRTAEDVYHLEVHFLLNGGYFKKVWPEHHRNTTAVQRMYEQSTLSYRRALEFANLVRKKPAFDPIKLDGISYDIVEIFKSLEAPLRQHPTLSSAALSLDRLPLSLFKNHLERIKRECSLSYLETDRNVCKMMATLKEKKYVSDIELARSDIKDYAHSLDYVSNINHANNILKLVVHGYAEALKSVLDP